MVLPNYYYICKKYAMRTPRYRDEIGDLLEKDGIITVEDFVASCPGMPKASVYSKIRSLLRDNMIHEVGRGQYRAGNKLKYKVEVSDWMRSVNGLLTDNCVGVNFCIYEHLSNLYIETSKIDFQKVYSFLKNHYSKVVFKKDAERFPAPLEGFIIIGQMVSDAPLMECEELLIPSIEKKLVDDFCSKNTRGTAYLAELQRSIEVHPVNLNRLHRYASRRGVSDEFSSLLSSLNQSRIELFSATQKYLATIPVVRAWVFGSFARMEERPDSDIDLLVDYDMSFKVSLLDTVGYKLGLEKIIGREVDLIPNGSLKPFAVESANKDKYLIYER